MLSPIRYVRSGAIQVAYRSFGSGPRDVLVALPTISTIELLDQPPARRIVDRQVRSGRVICWDRRGTGLSDRTPSPPTLEEQMDDADAVLDAVGAREVVLIAEAEAAGLAALYAASKPARVSRLILHEPMVRNTRAEGYEWAWTDEERRRALVEPMLARWGTGENGVGLAPALAGRDPQFIEWWGRWERLAAGPTFARAQLEMMARLDVRAVLPRIQAPTLVCTRPDSGGIDSRHAEYVAERIPGAELRRLPGLDSISFGDGFEAYADAVEEFAGGADGPIAADRVLATVMFTDIVGSTELAARLGDREWTRAFERHDELSRRLIAAHGGLAVKSTGDGHLATFDGPARAVRCARELLASATEAGLTLRAGLHTGEVERRPGDVGGMAVHVAARICDRAPDGRVLTSQTVRDLVLGSGIRFGEEIESELRGVPGRWRLVEVESD